MLPWIHATVDRRRWLPIARVAFAHNRKELQQIVTRLTRAWLWPPPAMQRSPDVEATRPTLKQFHFRRAASRALQNVSPIDGAGRRDAAGWWIEGRPRWPGNGRGDARGDRWLAEPSTWLTPEKNRRQLWTINIHTPDHQKNSSLAIRRKAGLELRTALLHHEAWLD